MEQQLSLDDIKDFAHITIKDFKKWLSRFDEDENISLIVLNSKNKIYYRAGNIYPISDMPAIEEIQELITE